LQAALWERKDRPEEAARVLESFIAGGRDNAVARSNLARLQWKNGDRTRAITTLRFALTQDPNQERALHFYAALLEQDAGWPGALGALEALAQAPGAWLAAWVGAQLASSREPEQVGRLLLLAAKQARVPFPPNPDNLLDLLASLPQEQQREVAGALRAFCRQEAQQKLDALLAVPRLGPQGGESVATCLRRSVWRHLSQPQTSSALGLAPICLIKPEGWGVAEVAGRLGRGFALLIAESLDAIAGCSAAVILETVPVAGVVARPSPQSGPDLAQQAGGSCGYLLSSYMSFKAPNEFILDTEIYDDKGTYVSRESCRAAHPGACLQQLAQRLSASLISGATPEPLPPMPDLEVEDALARETVASFLLCAGRALSAKALGNPGLSLDALVNYAVKAESGAAVLTLWAGIEAAARAGLPGGQAKRSVMADILARNEGLAYWTATLPDRNA
jgi:hypothetical protein